MNKYRISVLLWADAVVIFAFFTMQNYLTDVWKLTVTHAAGILNIWGGIRYILPVFLLFVGDQFLGNFVMLAISTIADSIGLGLVVMSISRVLANLNNSCKECIDDPTQEVAFFVGMSLLAVGLAGNDVFGNTIVDEVEATTDNSVQLECNCNWMLLLTFLMFLVSAFGFFAFPYMKSWTLLFGIPAICSAVATLVFLSGWRNYSHEAELQGSPPANVCRVFVASFCKRSESLPSDDAQRFYTNHPSEPRSFSRTRFLRFLHKAAIVLPDEIGTNCGVKNKWKLCSVAQVEEAKIVLRMIPVWLTFIVCGIVSSIGNSYFSAQANNMNRKIGEWTVPVPILYMLYFFVKINFENCASSFLMIKDDPKRDPSRIRRHSKNSNAKDKNHRPAIGIGIAMVLSVLCCITAAVIETQRLRVIRDHRLVDKPDAHIPMHAAWLIFQFILLAGQDSFLSKSFGEFHIVEGPKSMIYYAKHLAKGVNGVGYICGVVSVYVVGKVSQMGGRRSWFQHSLNESRLDRYYWVLAGLSSVNLVVYIGVASTYSYRKREAQEEAGE